MTDWTCDDDLFLAKNFIGMGDAGTGRQLGRQAGAATERVKFLMSTGAWQSLRDQIAADYDFQRAYHLARGETAEAEFLADTHPGSPERIPDATNRR